jgi:hypothetical protein
MMTPMSKNVAPVAGPEVPVCKRETGNEMLI